MNRCETADEHSMITDSCGQLLLLPCANYLVGDGLTEVIVAWSQKLCTSAYTVTADGGGED